ncbi:predicted protein [Plenodomus lingam JN3]|uniref:Predicted protein n=1 Tax=Leptosphaeria maculans (strain JN3 / isolate v23.1.3 / race Av1-4-5-6-7-8) TaxID=985895 RepID=E4ZLE6_LEPMJ|nr:predicted protein [Plenodomus lingam JN3]CBX92305.1 predicted protein [Plenodomus lingam JN3]
MSRRTPRTCFHAQPNNSARVEERGGTMREMVDGVGLRRAYGVSPGRSV